MVGSLILFVLFIITYIVISDIITVFFRLTGLTEENARFQVISLLTNSGFTTRESEVIVSSKIRRRLARATMVFGYAFTVTIVSASVNFFVNLGGAELASLLYILPILIAIMIVFQLLRKSSHFKTKFDALIESIGNQIMFGKHSNPIVLMEDYGDMVVAHVYLRNVPDIVKDMPLSQSRLMPDHNIMVIMVKNRDGQARQANAHTVLQKNDIIMVLGNRKSIRAVFEKI